MGRLIPRAFAAFGGLSGMIASVDPRKGAETTQEPFGLTNRLCRASHGFTPIVQPAAQRPAASRRPATPNRAGRAARLLQGSIARAPALRNLHAKVDSKPADIPSDGGDPCPRTPSEPSLLPAAEPRRCDIDLDRLTALGRGAAQIVHELNLPASLISGSLESLDHLVEILMGAVREGGPSHPEGAPAAREEVAYAIEHAPEVLRICRDGVARLTRLVGELRSLVNGPAPVPAPTPVDVARIVEDAVSSVAFAGRGSPVPHVQIHRGPDPEIALGCAGLLERAFANLIANAFEAVQACADARVSVAIADGPARPAGGGAPSIEITIRDNGPGIPREHRERIFEAFFTTKGRGGGMGLGLAITRDIVVGHGGEIGVAEAPPPGTAVIVRLPRARCA